MLILTDLIPTERDGETVYEPRVVVERALTDWTSYEYVRVDGVEYRVVEVADGDYAGYEVL